MKNAVIIVAAGAGKRFCGVCSNEVRSKIPKQFLKLRGKPVFLWSVEAFASVKSFKQIILVVPRDMTEALSLKYRKNFICVSGGRERFDSVKNGLAVVEDDIDFVAVHDAARPLISKSDILSVLRKAAETGAAVAVEKVKDTVKLVSGSGVILKTLNRAALRNAQTPQIFEAKIIKSVYSGKIPVNTTDDSQLVESLKVKISAVETKYPNFKVTTKQDFELASAVVACKRSV
jgi:2-C-methyl-D-erythritol 4-phosphate cytidylyltransferase